MGELTHCKPRCDGAVAWGGGWGVGVNRGVRADQPLRLLSTKDCGKSGSAERLSQGLFVFNRRLVRDQQSEEQEAGKEQAHHQTLFTAHSFGTGGCGVVGWYVCVCVWRGLSLQPTRPEVKSGGEPRTVDRLFGRSK